MIVSPDLKRRQEPTPRQAVTEFPWQPLPRGYQVAKRVIDLVGASALLAAFSPAWLAISLAIKLDSPGPALFRQHRIGQHARPFVVFKFRSMRADSDEGRHRRHIERLMQAGNPADGPDAEDGTAFKLEGDPRITRLGRLLRKTSLDEVPQLLNVIRGEMSLVGPRPVLPYEVEHYEPWQLERLRVLPGITGLWQVYARARVSYERMVQMDIEYARDPSLLLDLKLLLRTIPAVLSGAGAR
jgi:lipopolysaccharide/colanic/teichoic acid biosynthesis glycosyltransferase